MKPRKNPKKGAVSSSRDVKFEHPSNQEEQLLLEKMQRLINESQTVDKNALEHLILEALDIVRKGEEVVVEVVVRAREEQEKQQKKKAFLNIDFKKHWPVFVRAAIEGCIIGILAHHFPF